MTVPVPYRRTLLICCAAGMLFLALTPQPVVPESNGLDKIEHAFAFALLAVLSVWSLPWRFWRIIVMLIAFGILIEVLQGVLPINRDADVLDVMADSGGVLIGMALEMLVLRLSMRR